MPNRRLTNWAVSNVNNGIGPTSGAQSNFDVLGPYRLDTGVSSLQGHTVVRTLGEVAIKPDTPFVQTQQFTFGLIVLRGASVDIDPEQNNADWLWWDSFSVDGLGREHTSAVFEPGLTRRRVDSRAMRKLPGTDVSLWWVLKSATTAVTSNRYSVNLRVLLKLP